MRHLAEAAAVGNFTDGSSPVKILPLRALRQRSHEKTKAAGSGFRLLTQAPDRLSVRRDALERRTGVGIRHPAAAVRHNALPHRSGVGVVPARVSPPRLHVHVTVRLHGAVRRCPVCRRGLRQGDGAGAKQEAGNKCRQDFPVHFLHSPLLVIVEQQMLRCGSSPKATNGLMLRSGRFVECCYEVKTKLVAVCALKK